MLTFENFFPVSNPHEVKVKFNMNPADKSLPAWDLLQEDDSKGSTWYNMNAHKRKQSNHNLKDAKYLLTFAQYYPYGPDYYIFGGYYEVKKLMPEVYEGVGYNLALLDRFSEYRKRLIIKLEEPIGRNLYNRYYDKVIESLRPVVHSILPEDRLDTFPGYNRVLLSHRELQRVQNSELWIQALSNVKGIYVITDTSTGQLYIGSASGNTDGIWQRWSKYADVSNLSGGNKAFEELKSSGMRYIINNFTYSILEVFDKKTRREEIIQRESYWKKVFKTREFGMNKN